MLLQSFTLLPIRVAIFLAALLGSGLVHLCLGKVGEQNWIKR
jgi:1-acyl-sn-glycerol-3-phosphate acyltransferase